MGCRRGGKTKQKTPPTDELKASKTPVLTRKSRIGVIVVFIGKRDWSPDKRGEEGPLGDVARRGCGGVQVCANRENLEGT